MAGPLGDTQQELLHGHLSSQWQSTPQIATSIGVSASERDKYRALMRALQGLHNRGHVAKELKIIDNKATSMWRLVDAPVLTLVKPEPVTPRPSKRPPSKAAPVTKAVSKRPAKAHEIVRTKA